MFKKIIKNLLERLFPEFCVYCNKEGDFFCGCRQEFYTILQHNCLYCNQYTGGVTCDDCISKVRLDGYWTITSFSEYTKQIVHAIKYSNRSLSRDLCRCYIDNFFTSLTALDSAQIRVVLERSLVVAVPLHIYRLRERGFNQSEEIASLLIKKYSSKFVDNILVRNRYTPSQVSLTAQLREGNIKGAFSCVASEQVVGKSFVLVDDVYTTGATIHACCVALKEAGAVSVLAITFARGGLSL